MIVLDREMKSRIVTAVFDYESKERVRPNILVLSYDYKPFISLSKIHRLYVFDRELVVRFDMALKRDEFKLKFKGDIMSDGFTDAMRMRRAKTEEIVEKHTRKAAIFNAKPDLTFLNPTFMEKVALVFQEGSARDGRSKDGWKKLSFEQAMGRISSAYRHLMDIQKGEYFDEDSGLQNAYHLAANAMILAWHIAKKEEENNG